MISHQHLIFSVSCDVFHTPLEYLGRLATAVDHIADQYKLGIRVFPLDLSDQFFHRLITAMNIPYRIMHLFFL